ncbi:MAG: hypothetical protein M1358_00610, partial [Chloroflexi bacterium]|nr:hypothetical protein [Chloroflexota bacterium]
PSEGRELAGYAEEVVVTPEGLSLVTVRSELTGRRWGVAIDKWGDAGEAGLHDDSPTIDDGDDDVDSDGELLLAGIIHL